MIELPSYRDETFTRAFHLHNGTTKRSHHYKCSKTTVDAAMHIAFQRRTHDPPAAEKDDRDGRWPMTMWPALGAGRPDELLAKRLERSDKRRGNVGDWRTVGRHGSFLTPVQIDRSDGRGGGNLCHSSLYCGIRVRWRRCRRRGKTGAVVR